MFQFIRRLWKGTSRPAINKPSLDQPALTLNRDGSEASGSWLTLNEQDYQESRLSESKISSHSKSEPSQSSLIKTAIAKIRPKRLRHECIIDEDISNGRENHKIPAISYRPNDKPPTDYHYVDDYVQLEPVNLKLSLDSMSSCDCSGDCKSSACGCSSLNGCSTRYNSRGRLSSSYNLDAPELIYECNSGCKCNYKTCNNRVIQHGSQVKLALFRTKSRGWGVRALDRIKRGSFVGIYTGELVSTNDCHQRADDTYLFNLANTSNINPPADNSQAQMIDEKESERFVCDAKHYGNITRFINHSCDPNLVGIRSFTYHQDQRFPYIAFFANKDIRSGSELTINYGVNYWIVKGARDKVFCLCQRSRCQFNKRIFPQTLKAYDEQRNRS